MSDEEIIKEARFRYPTGSKVKSLAFPDNERYSGHVDWEKYPYISTESNSITTYHSIINSSGFYIPHANGNRMRTKVYDKATNVWSESVWYEWELLKKKLEI